MKEDLFSKIEQLGGMDKDFHILVSVDDFFKDNNVQGSFAANACEVDFDFKEFSLKFKEMEGMSTVQGVWIDIIDIDDDWAYSDTALVAIDASISDEAISNLFSKGAPSEISEVDFDYKQVYRIPSLMDGYKLLLLWWD